MVIKIGKNPAVATAQETTETDALDGLGGTPETKQAETTAPASDMSGLAGNTPAAASSHLSYGGEQQTAINQVKTAQDLRTRLRGGVWEFYLEVGSFANLYFLDGTVAGEGVFDTPITATHMLQIGGDWVKFICNKKIEGDCIVCDSNMDRSQPSTVQMFTVINTTPHTVKKGKNAGKVIPARLQMFSATPQVREKLMSRAVNNGGTLAGKLFKFTKSTPQEPRTGGDIELVSDQYPMASVLAKYPMLGGEKSDQPTQPIDYAQAFPILTNAEIAALRADVASMAGWTAPGQETFAQQAAATAAIGSVGDDEIPF
ncbi:MAG: hypothetical protein JKX85_13650 [Phycisphaeraceae bacterium]|nr:hypothetical protein [Phycisphaeraceae bacterium]